MSERYKDKAVVRPWIYYSAPSSRDINRLVSGGPTASALAVEREKRINIIRASKQLSHQRIAEKLARAPSCVPAMTAACPFHARKWQEYASSRMLKAFKRYSNDQIFMVTVADREHLTISELKNFDIKKFKNRLRKRLERQLPSTGVVFGVCEFAFDDQTHTFLPHCHLFIAGVPRSILEGMRRHYLPERNYGEKSLMRIDEVTDLPRQFSYALKINIYRRAQRKGSQRPQARRLRVEHYRAHMDYLDRHELSDFVFCKNALLHSSKPSHQPSAPPLTKKDIGRAILKRWLARNA